jgi:hypothetical protein
LKCPTIINEQLPAEIWDLPGVSAGTLPVLMEYNLGIQGEYDLVMKGGQCVEEHFVEGIEGNGPHEIRVHFHQANMAPKEWGDVEEAFPHHPDLSVTIMN